MRQIQKESNLSFVEVSHELIDVRWASKSIHASLAPDYYSICRNSAKLEMCIRRMSSTAVGVTFAPSKLPVEPILSAVYTGKVELCAASFSLSLSFCVCAFSLPNSQCRDGTRCIDLAILQINKTRRGADNRMRLGLRLTLGLIVKKKVL